MYYFKTEKIRDVFNSAGFKTNLVMNSLLVGTDPKTYIEIVNKGEYAYFEDANFITPNNITPNNVENRKQFFIDYDVKLLEAANMIVINDATSITIFGIYGKIDVQYDEYGGIYDFKFHKLPPVTLGRMGSMIGSDCDEMYREQYISAREEDDDDDFIF